MYGCWLEIQLMWYYLDLKKNMFIVLNAGLPDIFWNRDILTADKTNEPTTNHKGRLYTTLNIYFITL
jgi:hypothetical protein